jgi:SAM-dependent methyltransferase
VTVALPDVYDSPADWAAGPERVYDVLAAALLDGVGDLTAHRCLDVGAGTGVASRVLAGRGGDVFAVDLSLPMLAWQSADRPPAAVGDVERLPFADASFDLAVAAFCLNHLGAVEPALHELTRVLRPGGRLVASTWHVASDPVKQTAEAVLRSFGWAPPSWYADLQAVRHATGEPDRLAASAAGCGLRASCSSREVRLALSGAVLAGWRLHMPHTTAWFATLDHQQRAEVSAAMAEALDGQPWAVRMVVLDALRPA